MKIQYYKTSTSQDEIILTKYTIYERVAISDIHTSRPVVSIRELIIIIIKVYNI